MEVNACGAYINMYN